MRDVSKNTLERLCRIFGYLATLEKQGVSLVSSQELARAIDATEYTVRKDISVVAVTGYTRKGYEVDMLKEALGEKLQLTKKRHACIVGLGRLGTSLLHYENFQDEGFDIVAGFDCSINKLERIRTQIDLFPVSQMASVIAARHIEVGIIAVPANAAQQVADTLVVAGVRGILNFSPIKVTVPKGIINLDIDFTSALRFIAAQL